MAVPGKLIAVKLSKSFCGAHETASVEVRPKVSRDRTLKEKRERCGRALQKTEPSSRNGNACLCEHVASVQSPNHGIKSAPASQSSRGENGGHRSAAPHSSPIKRDGTCTALRKETVFGEKGNRPIRLATPLCDALCRFEIWPPCPPPLRDLDLPGFDRPFLLPNCVT